MKIALLHGFNVRDGGEATLGRWRDVLRAAGHDVTLVDYGWVGPVTVRIENHDVVQRLRAMQPDIIFGHSNGAAIAWHYARTGANLTGVVCIQPALNTETVWPANVQRVACLHNPHDWAVYLGRLWRLMNPVSWFIRHPWGAAGRHGFEHADERFTQFDTACDPIHPYRGHSISRLSAAGARYWALRALAAVVVGSFQSKEASHA